MTYFAWVDQRENDFEAVRSEAKRLVKTALESAGLDLPEPIYRLRIARSDAPPQPPRPARDEPAPAAETPTPVDTTIDAQIQVERETSEDDLLSYDAPLE